MNRRVSSKKRVEKGGKKRNRRPHVVSTPCHQPWSQPHPHTLHFTLLTTSPVFLLLRSSLFLCCSFWLEDKRRMDCVMSNNYTKVALLFLCQPSFSNHLFLLVTSCRSCHCGVFFIHNQFCGLLSAYQPTACQPHSLRRERWGLSRYGLKPGRVE